MEIGLIDFLILAVIAGVTWCVAAEGAVGAGTTFLCIVLSGLLAMNFFEPLASALDGIGFLRSRSDMVALLGLFGVFVGLMRLACEQISPTFVPLHGLAYDLGRWTFGVFSGYVTAAILLTALHTAPFPREFAGFTPERRNLFDAAAPDRQWLGFVQYVTERPFVRWQRTPPMPDAPEGWPIRRMFDGRTAWHWGLSDQDGKKAVDVVMPSFVARYATRRELLGGGPPVDAPAAAPTTQPVPTRSGGGGPNF